MKKLIINYYFQNISANKINPKIRTVYLLMKILTELDPTLAGSVENETEPKIYTN